MRRTQWMKAFAAFVLSCGFVVLVGYDDLLAAGKAEEAKQWLQKLEKAKNAKERKAAIDELGKIGEVSYNAVEPGISTLQNSLDDKDETVRGAAALALGKIGPDNSDALVTKLTKMLQEEKTEAVRIQIVQGLGFLGDQAKAATPALQKLRKGLDDQKGKLSRSIKAALKTIQPPKKKNDK